MDIVIDITAPMVWVGLIVLFSIIEALTLGLTTIWFAGASLLALFVSLLGLPVWLQVATFIVSSIVLLIFTKPMAKNYLKIGNEKTNVDSVIGATGLVTVSIQPFAMGQVKVNGQIWSALSENGELVEAGKRVTVLGVEGVKLIVRENH